METWETYIRTFDFNRRSFGTPPEGSTGTLGTTWYECWWDSLLLGGEREEALNSLGNGMPYNPVGHFYEYKASGALTKIQGPPLWFRPRVACLGANLRRRFACAFRIGECVVDG